MHVACPICNGRHEQVHFGVRDGYDYYACSSCDSLYIEPAVLARIDEGHTTREYDADYWNSELKSARERSQAEGLVCAGEAIIYARRPVKRFLDVGAGPGYLLDELAARYPAHPDTFHAVELFPPEERSPHPNYIVGDVGSLTEKFDAGVCIEVVEHLTPRMKRETATAISSAAAKRIRLWPVTMECRPCRTGVRARPASTATHPPSDSSRVVHVAAALENSCFSTCRSPVFPPGIQRATPGGSRNITVELYVLAAQPGMAKRAPPPWEHLRASDG